MFVSCQSLLCECDVEPKETITMSPVERRALIKGAAWTVPVLATSVGVPLAVASTTAVDGAAISSNGPLESPDGTNPTVPGRPLYLSGKTYTFQATFQNVGTTPINPGYTWSVVVLTSRRGNPDTTYFVWSTPVLTGISSPYTTSIENSGNGALYFTLNQALPAGGTFTVTYTASVSSPLGPNGTDPYFSTITYALAEDDANTANGTATGPVFDVSDSA